MKPTVGRIVQYMLSAEDAADINRRRDDFSAYTREHPRPEKRGHPGATGHAGHVGNPAAEGDVCAAMVVQVFDPRVSTVNLQVHLDGNDTYWATSRTEGDGPGTWHWPVIAREPGDRPPRH